MRGLRHTPDTEWPPPGRPGPPGQGLGLGLGLGRTVLGMAWLAAPVSTVRLLGLDTATATRVTWLARMAAARDLALGLGTVRATACRRGAAGWLLAGAASDLADAALVEHALRQGRAKGLPASAVVIASAGAAAAGTWAAVAAARQGRISAEG